MRPAGVVDRIRAAQHADRAWHEERPELRLGALTRRFISLSGLQWYDDHPVERPLEVLAEITAENADASERWSDYARRGLTLATTLTTRMPHRNEEGALSPEDQDEARELLTTLPRRVLLRREDPDAAADLVLVNEANWHGDGFSTAYGAASVIAAVGYYRPDDRWRLAELMTELRVRYEDDVAGRPDTAAAISEALREFLVQYEDWWRDQGE